MFITNLLNVISILASLEVITWDLKLNLENEAKSETNFELKLKFVQKNTPSVMVTVRGLESGII